MKFHRDRVGTPCPRIPRPDHVCLPELVSPMSDAISRFLGLHFSPTSWTPYRPPIVRAKANKSELFQGHIGRNTANGNHISVFQTRCTGIRMFLQPKHGKPVGRLPGGQGPPSENPEREVRDLPGRDRVPDRRLSAMCPTWFHVGCRRRERNVRGQWPRSCRTSIVLVIRPADRPPKCC